MNFPQTLTSTDIEYITLPNLGINLIPVYSLWLSSSLNQSSSFSNEVSSGGDCFGSASTRQTAGSKDKQSLSMISKSLSHQHIKSNCKWQQQEVALIQSQQGNVTPVWRNDSNVCLSLHLYTTISNSKASGKNIYNIEGKNTFSCITFKQFCVKVGCTLHLLSLCTACWKGHKIIRAER